MKEASQYRSQQYQHIFKEIYFDDQTLGAFSNDDGLHVNPVRASEISEAIYDLKEKLFKRFWTIAKINMTKRQYLVSRMLGDGYTQVEIAKKLKINQSSCSKTMNGNNDPNYPEHKFGGVVKKMKKLLDEDVEFNNILQQIKELQ